MALYPWQITAWQQLMVQRASLPHALLLTGEEGVGKRQFAEYLAQYLLCESNEKGDHPCQHCVACGWFIEGNHPDFRLLSVEESTDVGESEAALHKKGGHWITVEAVRTLNDFMHIGAHRAGRRIVVVYPAEVMNLAAANALLKMLEEPPEGVLFILISHRWQRLLATITSRCRRLSFPIPDEGDAVSWLSTQQVAHPLIHLRHCGGAPLQAHAQALAVDNNLFTTLLAKLAEPKKWNVVTLAAEIEKLKAETIDIIDCFQRWVVDNVLYQMTGKARYYPDYQSSFQGIGRFGTKLWPFYTELLQARRYALHPLNQRLLLEKIFYGWIDVLKEAQQSKP